MASVIKWYSQNVSNASKTKWNIDVPKRQKMISEVPKECISHRTHMYKKERFSLLRTNLDTNYNTVMSHVHLWA